MVPCPISGKRKRKKMGTDNLFHKRKARNARELARRRARRKTSPRILIVCEGEKTEPNYFRGLKNELRLNSANIEITGESNSSPTSVVAFARKRYEKQEKAGFPFDKVFCVFDKNSHTDYQQALTQITAMKPNNVFRAITFVPAFEYFLLLHYEFTTSHFTSKQVLSALKKYIPKYRKGNKNIFNDVRDRLDVAKSNTEESLKAAIASNTDNPSTKAHELVEFMQTMRD